MCPNWGFVVSKLGLPTSHFRCGAAFENCQACFGNSSQPPLITDTAVACQTACVGTKGCAAFQWIGMGGNVSGSLHHQCIFKCAGAVTPGRVECWIGLEIGEAGGAFVCGPARNDSSAPPPPGPPPPPSGPPPPLCPVPFGLSSGQLEPGILDVGLIFNQFPRVARRRPAPYIMCAMLFFETPLAAC